MIVDVVAIVAPLEVHACLEVVGSRDVRDLRDHVPHGAQVVLIGRAGCLGPPSGGRIVVEERVRVVLRLELEAVARDAHRRAHFDEQPVGDCRRPLDVARLLHRRRQRVGRFRRDAGHAIAARRRAPDVVALRPAVRVVVRGAHLVAARQLSGQPQLSVRRDAAVAIDAIAVRQPHRASAGPGNRRIRDVAVVLENAERGEEPEAVLDDRAAERHVVVPRRAQLVAFADVLPQVVGDVLVLQAGAREEVSIAAGEPVPAFLGNRIHPHAAERGLGGLGSRVEHELFLREVVDAGAVRLAAGAGEVLADAHPVEVDALIGGRRAVHRHVAHEALAVEVDAGHEARAALH